MLLDDFCDGLGIKSSYNASPDEHESLISNLDGMQEFFGLILPYLIVKKERVEVMLTEVIPRMRRQKHHTKDGLLEMMPYVDEVNAVDRKYDNEYFKKEFQS